MNRTLFIAAGAVVMTASLAAAAPGDHFVENWDLDEDGTVTLTEIETRRGDVFSAFDADQSGAIDAQEYLMFDEARENDMANEEGQGQGQGGGLRRASRGMTLDFNDIDGNGEVSAEEFQAQAKAWLVMIDRDGSGDITTADFGRN